MSVALKWVESILNHIRSFYNFACYFQYVVHQVSQFCKIKIVAKDE